MSAPNPNLLEECVTDGLEHLIGDALVDVRYVNVEGDAVPDQDALAAAVSLRVDLLWASGRITHVSWDENAGWPDHFSVEATRDPVRPGTRCDVIDASRSAIWAPLVGRRVTRIDVLGHNETPHALRFVAGKSAVLVGDGYGYELTFVDGDDVIVMTEEEARRRGQLGSIEQVFWSRAAAD